jgi:hypothetical protein
MNRDELGSIGRDFSGDGRAGSQTAVAGRWQQLAIELLSIYGLIS